MARIIGGIGTSHVPTIGMAFDRGKQSDPDWRPLFQGYAPVGYEFNLVGDQLRDQLNPRLAR